MSYEGRVQVLCRNGHYDEMDCRHPFDFDEEGHKERMLEYALTPRYFDRPPELWKCPSCGEVAGWCNDIDDTNCDEYGKASIVQVSEPEYATCNLGHKHETKAAVYKPGSDGCSSIFLNGGLK